MLMALAAALRAWLAPRWKRLAKRRTKKNQRPEHHEATLRPPPTPNEQRSIPWRQAETLLGRYDELRVNFDAPSQYDSSYRPADEWNRRYARFEAALGRLETATEGAPIPWYEDFRETCSAIGDVLNAPAPEPRGKSHYLNLSSSGVMNRLRDLTQRARAAAGEPAEPGARGSG